MKKQRHAAGYVPPRPEEKSISIAMRYTDTKHVHVSAYKMHVILQLPGADTFWMKIDSARKLIAALHEAIESQEQIDAWTIKHQPDSYDARHLKRRRTMKAKKIR